jgi:hypothetical protein
MFNVKNLDPHYKSQSQTKAEITANSSGVRLTVETLKMSRTKPPPDVEFSEVALGCLEK